MKKELNRLSSDIKAIITSGKKIQAQSVNMLSQVFNLRIKALKWLADDKNFDYLEMPNDIFPQIEELKSNIKLEVLTENLLFALRCNQRVVESIVGTSEFSPDSFTSNISQLPDITYQQFIASLAFANLDDETSQKIVDWTNASLHIEFVLVAADIIGDDKLKISDKTINELAFLVADAAQEYSALATELGILKTRSTRQSFSNLSFDNSFIKEQKQLADLGLDDFAANLSN
ncbi:MAG: hypothetical protein IAE84_09685 [Saprospiraceae bacterium]|nr:hypothetical protein [Saprospiraceae bacterium]HRD80615.1 hypothetical protein [Saprospiraceae bacterium]